MRTGIGLFALLLLLTACQGQADPAVSDAWIRLPAIPGRPGVAYVTVEGGSDGVTMVAASTPIAVRAELHETMKASGGVMSMDSLPGVVVPARGSVTFAPGGRHIMLFDMNPKAQPGQTAPLIVRLADGRSLTAQAKLVPAGAEKP